MKKISLFIVLFAVCMATFALKPSREYKVTPEEFGLNSKEITINTDDGIRLNAWFIKPAKESKKVIIISDDGDGNMADNLEIASQFLSMDYHVLLYDYRGYGKSDDFKINPNFYIYPQFSKDLGAAITHLKKYNPTLAIDLFGIGLGGALSIGAGANRTEVRRVIADGPYITLDALSKKMQDNNLSVIMPPVYDKMFMEPLYAMQSKGTHLYGLLYITGEKDLLSTPDDIKELIKVNRTKGNVYIAKGATNAENFTSNKTMYFDEIKKFLSKN